MRSQPGNLHKEAKALPSSKARPNKAQLRSTLEKKLYFCTAFALRCQTFKGTDQSGYKVSRI